MFAVAGCRVTGAREQVVSRLARGMGVKTPEVVPVVRALVKMVRSLPEYAWKTRRLPAPVLAVREAFEKARSPEKLLFLDLPAALGLTLPDGDATTEADIEPFFAALNSALRVWADALPQMMLQARADLLASCNLPLTDSGWAMLRERCVLLRGRVSHSLLLPFMDRVTETDRSRALESVLALLASRAPQTWSEADYERFLVQSRIVGGLLSQADAPEALLPAPHLTPQEEVRSRSLADTILLRHGTNRRVLRAALLTLLNELNLADEENTDNE